MEDVELAVALDGDQAQLTARTLTEATIWGGHGNWRLQLKLTYERRNEEWIALDSVASVW